MKQIGVIGSGQVGKVLATGFLKKGYDVMLGSRDSSKLATWKEENNESKTGSFEETAKFGEILVLAVSGKAAESALQICGVPHIKGKIIIDATNPISSEPPENGVIKYFTDLNSSLMEKLQDKFPESDFVKSFSCVGNAFMVDPQFEEGKPTMFICGNNETARNEVAKILDEFGWEVEDLGSAVSARAIEPLAILWCIPGILRNQWGHALKLLKK